MSFPLTVGDVTLPDPAALGAFVQSECGPEPVQVPGRRPSEWLPELVAQGLLERRLAVGLTAALLQNASAGTIAEGARLAEQLQEPLLGPILVRALIDHDPVLLLQVDRGGASVEDTLTAAVERVADLSDEAVRRPFLQVLRNAGLGLREVRVLAAHGTPYELATWLPAVLAEPLDDEAEALLRARAARDDEGGRIVGRLLG